MNPIFKQLPIEVVKDNIFSYLDTDTKMKLKYREIEKYDNITKELSNIDINVFRRLYNIYIEKLNESEKVLIKNILKKYDNNINYLLLYYIEKIYDIRNNQGYLYDLITHTEETFKRYAYIDIDYKNNSYNLKFKTVKELKQLCKMNNLKKYSKLKKNELIRLLLSV